MSAVVAALSPRNATSLSDIDMTIFLFGRGIAIRSELPVDRRCAVFILHGSL
jgi:hypothetical protein